MPRIAYLMSQYPKTSHTFIQREIVALEGLGADVRRFALRRPSDTDGVCDPDELRRTAYVLDVGMVGLLRHGLRELARDPRRFLKTAVLAARFGRRSDTGLAIHMAYFLEACVLRSWLERDGVDHVHAHFGTNAPMVAMLCKHLGGPRYSFTLHGPGEFDVAPLISLDAKIAEAEFVAAISNFARSQAFRWCSHHDWQKIHIVRCGLDASYIDALETRPADEPPVLVNVGRLHEQKGQQLLLDAAAKLREDGLAFRIVIIGDGELRDPLEALRAELHLENVVAFEGWLDNKATAAAVAGGRAMVMSSFAEGVPVVLMEAMALHRPVIAPRVAGIPELVDADTGWLVTPGSSGELADAMRELLQTPRDELARMGLAGHRRVAELHDIRKEAAHLWRLMNTDDGVEPLLAMP